MANPKVLIFILISLFLGQCSASHSSHQSPNNSNQQLPTAATDYKTFIAGTWEGWTDRRVMYVTFNGNEMTVDYSPSGGGKFTVPYRLRMERTLETGRYPENLVIEKYTDDEFRLRPERAELRADIDLIYACSFVRPMK